MKNRIIFMCLFIVIIIFAGLVLAEEQNIGFVRSVSGNAFISHQKKIIPAKVNYRLYESDALITGTDGSMGVVFQDNGILSIGPKSKVELNKFSFIPIKNKLAFTAKIKKGTMVYLTGLIAKLNRQSVRVETPTSACGVRGTHFAIKVDASDDEDDVVLATKQ